MTIVVEPMTEEILPEIVPLHMDAFADYMNTKLGVRYVQAFLSWFVRQPDSVALAATREGGAVGFVVGAPFGYQRRLNRDLVFDGLWGMAKRPQLLFQRRVLVACWRKFLLMTGLQENESPELNLPGPTMNLVGIGVCTRAQGGGVGHRLMTAFEAASRSRGMNSMCLTVYRTSAPARRLYEKHGWTCHESPSEDSLYYYKAIPEGEKGAPDASQGESRAVNEKRL